MDSEAAVGSKSRARSNNYMSYYVYYGKVIDDKKQGIKITYPFLGGQSETEVGAEQIARDLVNDKSQQAIIIPKIFESDSIIVAMFDAKKKFKRMATNMYECAEIVGSTMAVSWEDIQKRLEQAKTDRTVLDIVFTACNVITNKKPDDIVKVLSKMGGWIEEYLNRSG